MGRKRRGFFANALACKITRLSSRGGLQAVYNGHSFITLLVTKENERGLGWDGQDDPSSSNILEVLVEGSQQSKLQSLLFIKYPKKIQETSFHILMWASLIKPGL